MRSRHVLLKLSPHETLLEFLLLLSLGLQVLAVCPSLCTCSHSHREVDCSWRGLRQLPDNLQHNIRSLNLSHNRFHNLDGQLTTHTHLRFLDLSHNRLSHLPTGLPRSLWNLYASSNRLQLLEKNDTVYQWNLRMLDLSNNRLERAIFINNTLINLCTLNLSHNHLRTLPTNLPAQLETIDLSHNSLAKVLPGSLDRLLKLAQLYLHANNLPSLPYGVFDKLVSLKVVTLGDNPWDCHLYADVAYLRSWSQRTSTRVLGCPCHTQPTCGGMRPSRTGGWHFAPYNLPPLAASAQDQGSVAPEASVTGWWYVSSSSLQSTPNAPQEIPNTLLNNFRTTSASSSTLAPRSTGKHRTINHLSIAEHMLHTDYYLVSPTTADSLHTSDLPLVSDTSFITSSRADMTPATDRFFTTESPTTQTKRTTTLRTRSVRRHNQSSPRGIGNSSPAHPTYSLPTLLHNLLLLLLLILHPCL
ncbi:oligodendrocyte-myelin glycoprotein-like isoform X1 [Xyrichtys novacula]|uniref:Oligodendrocyte-myelin glycoprotein-like isoform X1 n=1 Tax=Xyrichtys novacula TaxID=13765 RepID=A0AAV1FVR8_XYRNO|nr:oligodendrocyte-myelin glycoprotein-like isoform X1 [Xyrichtys novacula]